MAKRNKRFPIQRSRKLNCLKCLSPLPCQKCSMERSVCQQEYHVLSSLVAKGYDPQLLWSLYEVMDELPRQYVLNRIEPVYSISELQIHSDVFQSILHGQLFYFSAVLKLLEDVVVIQDLQFMILRYNIEPLPFLDGSGDTRTLVLQLLGENPSTFETISKSGENIAKRVQYSSKEIHVTNGYNELIATEPSIPPFCDRPGYRLKRL